MPIHPSTTRSSARDAFRTATGVHAAAIIKAEKKGDAWLADRDLLRRARRHVRQGAGDRDRALLAASRTSSTGCKKRGYEPTKELVAAVLGAAKRGNRVLSDDEIVAAIKAAKA